MKAFVAKVLTLEECPLGVLGEHIVKGMVFDGIKIFASGAQAHAYTLGVLQASQDINKQTVNSLVVNGVRLNSYARIAINQGFENRYIENEYHVFYTEDEMLHFLLDYKDDFSWFNMLEMDFWDISSNYTSLANMRDAAIAYIIENHGYTTLRETYGIDIDSSYLINASKMLAKWFETVKF